MKSKNFRLRRAVLKTNGQKPCSIILVKEKTPPEGRRKFLGIKIPHTAKSRKKTLVRLHAPTKEDLEHIYPDLRKDDLPLFF